MAVVSAKTSRTKKPEILLQAEERPFWQELEDMLASPVLAELDEGHMRGSMSGESWKMFLKNVRDEVLLHLECYRRETDGRGFNASTLAPYREEKKKIERTYLRNLAVLYRTAEKAYKNISG